MIWMINMWIALVILGILILITLLYLFSLKGRVGYTDFKDFKGKQFAHRGLHGNGIPENSLAAFKNAYKNGFGSELDVHLLKDGELAVIHDASLLRTTGIDRKIEELTLSEVKELRLENTDEQIPTFKEVLEVYNGEYPLIIELKATMKNVNALCETVMKQLEDYKGVYCIEGFDPRCVRWLKKHSPQTIRGQLADNFVKTRNPDLPWYLRIFLGYMLGNFMGRPDFVAYNFQHKKTWSFRICTKLWKIQGAAWTLKNKQEIDAAILENLIPIFEDRD